MTQSCPQLCLMSARLIYFIWAGASTLHGDSQARGQVRAIVAGLHHSYSNTRSKLYVRPTPQLRATPDPWLSERGQGSHCVLMILVRLVTTESQQELPQGLFKLCQWINFAEGLSRDSGGRVSWHPGLWVHLGFWTFLKKKTLLDYSWLTMLC